MADSYGGLLSGDDPTQALYGGVLDPNALQTLQRKRALQGLYAFGAAAGQASAPSRLPISMGQVMGAGVGAMDNSNANFDNTIGRQLLAPGALTSQRIQNANAALGYNLWAPYLGVSPISVGSPGGGGAITPGAQPASAAQGASPSPSPSGGGLLSGSSAPPTGGAPAGGGDMMTMLSSMPPPLLQKMGITVPPELTAAFYAGIKPGTPEYQTIVRNVAIKASGVAPTIGGERAGVP